MIRYFSHNEQLNPDGWEGNNWENRGYDVISYFPSFEKFSRGRGPQFLQIFNCSAPSQRVALGSNFLSFQILF